MKFNYFEDADHQTHCKLEVKNIEKKNIAHMKLSKYILKKKEC